MRRLRPFIALLLLPLWFSATVHCGIEVLGELLSHDHGHGLGNLCNEKEACARDACDLLEDSGYRGDVAAVSVEPLPDDGAALPPVAALWLVSVLDGSTAEVWKPPVDYERPRLPAWQFERRAAPWPGAPALLRS